MIQYHSVEDLNISSDHEQFRLTLFCLNAKSGDMPNIDNNYLHQNILLFEKTRSIPMEISVKNKFSKEFYLTTANRSILPTSNAGRNPKIQPSIDNRLENIEDAFISSTNTITKNQSKILKIF